MVLSCLILTMSTVLLSMKKMKYSFHSFHYFFPLQKAVFINVSVQQHFSDNGNKTHIQRQYYCLTDLLLFPQTQT